MKKIGIIGGLGPESTSEYYSSIIEAFKPDYNSLGFPEIIIESLNLKTCLGYVKNNNWPLLAQAIAQACNHLLNSGAVFGAIASNTPHRIYSEITSLTNLPLISIVEETKKTVITKGLKKLILLGTQFTMSSDFYQKSFSKSEIELITPSEKDQAYIQEKIFDELQLGIINDETKRRFIKTINDLSEEHNAQGVILACTELPLLLKANDLKLAYIDPTQIHIHSIVAMCRS